MSSSSALLPEVVQLVASIAAEGRALTVSQLEFAAAADRVVALPPAAKVTAAEHVVALALRIGREAGDTVQCEPVLEALADLTARLLGSQAAAKDLFQKQQAGTTAKLSGDPPATSHPPVDSGHLWK